MGVCSGSLSSCGVRLVCDAVCDVTMTMFFVLLFFLLFFLFFVSTMYFWGWRKLVKLVLVVGAVILFVLGFISVVCFVLLPLFP